MVEHTEPQLTGIVLAGGRSTRMGRDKASLVLGGRTLLQRAVDALNAVADEVVVVRAPGQRLPDIECSRPLRVVEDAIEGEGPLVGIAAGLEAAAAPVALVVGCDMPFLRPELLRLLAGRAASGAQLVVPLHQGRPQSLCSAIRSEALPVVRAHIEAGDRRIMAIADDLAVVLLPEREWAAADPDGRSFADLDTVEEFEQAQRAGVGAGERGASP